MDRLLFSVNSTSTSLKPQLLLMLTKRGNWPHGKNTDMHAMSLCTEA